MEICNKKEKILIRNKACKSKRDFDIIVYYKNEFESNGNLNTEKKMKQNININKNNKTNKKQNIKIHIQLKLIIHNIFIKFLIIFNLIQILPSTKFHLINSKFSKITLKIKGTGRKIILGHESDNKTIFNESYYPDEIYINGIKQDVITYFYDFTEVNNDVELIWNNTITSCKNMFRVCYDIVEFDFSQFDTSQVTEMDNMFRKCISLISLNLTTFDTSRVKKMNGMFFGCSSLTSLNLSNFEYFELTNME